MWLLGRAKRRPAASASPSMSSARSWGAPTQPELPRVVEEGKFRIYLNICVYIYIYTCIHTYLYMYAYTSTYVHTHVDTYTYTFLFPGTYMHIHLYIHTYIIMHICITFKLTTFAQESPVHIFKQMVVGRPPRIAFRILGGRCSECEKGCFSSRIMTCWLKSRF